MGNVGNDYFYGAYVKFVLNGSGGGSGTGTPQTGDWLGIVLISLLVTALIAATVIAFVKRNSLVDIAKSISAKSGTVVSALSNHRVIVAAIIAIAVLLIAGITFSSKAFAKDGRQDVASPPYQVVNATFDAETNTISIPTVHISDPNCIDESAGIRYFRAKIESFSISPVNDAVSSELGTWTVYLDNIQVYSGPALASIQWLYLLENVGECDIDIEVSGVSLDTVNKLNGKVCASIGFNCNALIDTSQIPETFTAKVSLTDNTNKFTKESGFEDYINTEGWEAESDNLYKKGFTLYTSYDEILQPWKAAVNNGLLTCYIENKVFYNWLANNLEDNYNNMLVEDTDFYPLWAPTEKTIGFSYKVGAFANSPFSAYGQQVITNNGWQIYKEDPELGGTDPVWYVKGQISNWTDADWINAQLNSNCFNFEDVVLSGWDYVNCKLFEIMYNDTEFLNVAEFTPIYVMVSGAIQNETGAGIPNISVSYTLIPKWTGNVKFGRQSSAGYDGSATITDSRGNYLLSIPKGTNGVLHFGASCYVKPAQDYIGESILVENAKEQVIPSVVVKTKSAIEATVKWPNSNEQSNGLKVDYGMCKFITTDNNGNEKVFYQTDFNEPSCTFTIETFANVSGKLVFESPMFYGECLVSDTGTSVDDPQSFDLHVDFKKEAQSDCLVTGSVVLHTADGYTPLANATLTIKYEDCITQKRYTGTIHTDENGNYTLKSFEGAYVKVITYTDENGQEWKSPEYSAVMFFGQTYTLNIVMYKVGSSDDIEYEDET